MNYKHRKCKLGQIGLIKKSSISKDLKIVFFYFHFFFQRHSLGRCRKEAWKMLMELWLVHVWQLQEPQSKTQGPTSVPPLTPMALIWDCRNSLLKQLLIVTKALVLRWFKASFFFFLKRSFHVEETLQTLAWLYFLCSLHVLILSF